MKRSFKILFCLILLVDSYLLCYPSVFSSPYVLWGVSIGVLILFPVMLAGYRIAEETLNIFMLAVVALSGYIFMYAGWHLVEWYLEEKNTIFCLVFLVIQLFLFAFVANKRWTKLQELMEK